MSSKPDWGLRTVALVFGIPSVIILAYLAYLFVSVVFLGEGSSCPQNSC